MIYPKNQRSASYAVAHWLYKNGPATGADAVQALAGKFSVRTIQAACWQLKREQMADDDTGLYVLRRHIIKFFIGCEQQERGDAPPPAPPAYRPNLMAARPYRSPARVTRDGADDYKAWPSHHAQLEKGPGAK